MDSQKELEVLSRLRVSLQGLNVMLEAIGVTVYDLISIHLKKRTWKRCQTIVSEQLMSMRSGTHSSSKLLKCLTYSPINDR
jgi:hypothetical protein